MNFTQKSKNVRFIKAKNSIVLSRAFKKKTLVRTGWRSLTSAVPGFKSPGPVQWKYLTNQVHSIEIENIDEIHASQYIRSTKSKRCLTVGRVRIDFV